MKKLEEIPKKKLFQAPEGYFESLPDQIRRKIDSRKSQYWYQTPRLQVAFASITILAVLSIITLTQFGNNGESIQEELSSISQDELLEFLGTSDISLTEIASGIDEESEVFKEIFDQTLQYDANELEEDLLLDLEPYTDEIL